MHKIFVWARRFGMAVLLGSTSAAALWAQESQSPDLMFVFDASGSMWGQVDGTTKIEIARDVFNDLSQSWAGSDQAVGMIAYGHRRRGDCSDIELLERPSVEAAQSLAERVQELVPRGKTPLSQAVRMAAEEMKFTENAATVVLLSDGIETCNLDPCAVGAELEQLGVNFTAHVIGFDIQSDAEKAQLQCLAENTGGLYIDARDAGSLSDALTTVTASTTEPVVEEPTGTVPVNVALQLAEGTAQPASVSLKAINAVTSEVVILGQFEGAAEVLNGTAVELEEGHWVFQAEGDGGTGTIDVNVTRDTETVYIPFTAGQANFAIVGATSFPTDQSFTLRLEALTDLQENATYEVMLFPAGATEYDQNIYFTYRFGSDKGVTEHYYYPDQNGLSAGDYEIIIMQGGYDLADNLGRFPIKLTEPGAALVDIALQAQFPDGREVTGPTTWFLTPEGANGDLMITTNGGVGVFEDVPLGIYDVTVSVDTPNGQSKGEARITVSDRNNTQFTIQIDEPAPVLTLDQLQEPLSPGVKDALRINGRVGAAAQAMFIGLDGQSTMFAPVREGGLVSIPPNLAPGVYRLNLVRSTGDETFLDTIDILPDSAQSIGDHSYEGEDPSTMMSEEELAAESGPQTPYFEIWKQCDGPDPCRVRDRRVDLEWALPPVWATGEPYYYTTAGGARAEQPTVDMARLDRGEFIVVLNPRQWDAQLGPCEAIARGQICRSESEVELDLQDYQIIKDGLEGKLPQPEGWLPLGRSWTILDRALDMPFGLLKIDTPTERAETTTGYISVTSEVYLGITDTTPAPVEFQLYWSNEGLVEGLYGHFEVEGKAYNIRLARPSDFDGSRNVWRGEITQEGSFQAAIIDIF